MKAAVFLGSKRIKVLDVKKPVITDDEVLVKTSATGICGSDLRFYVGNKKGVLQNLLNRAMTFVSPSKSIIGHEFSGSVVEKGKNVTDVDLDDRVTAWPIIPCNECRYCKNESKNLCENTRPWSGAFAEFVKVPAKNVIKLPEQVSFEEAAMLEPLACAVHGIRHAKIEKHHSVAILGAGTIGLLVLQVAKALGVKQAVVFDLVPFKLELAKKLGADVAINCSEINPLGKEGVTNDIDIIFECVGGADHILNQAANLVDKRGTVVMFGTFQSVQQLNLLKFRQNELTLLGTEGSEKQDFVSALNLLVSKKVNVKPLITHTFPLAKIQEAFNVALENQKTQSIKVQLNP